MVVLLVMAQTTVTNLSSHQSKRFESVVKGWIVLLGIIMLTLSSCERKSLDGSPVWGKTKDVTENLHHRLQAEIFEIDKDPVICELIPKPSWTLRVPFKPRTGTREQVRISWERGSFWVKTDDHALVVIYLDKETVFGHIQVSPSNGFQILFQFRELLETPIRDPLRLLLGM